MTGEQESDKKVVGGTGINTGGNVSFGNVSGQVAIGENIKQIQSISATDLDDLRTSLLDLKNGIDKLNLPFDDQEIVKGDLSAAVKEAKKDKPELSIIKEKFESAINTIKEADKTIDNISELYEPAKKIAKLVGIGIALL
ncbi:hypothetical protein [Methanolobus sp. WCC4]|uniref:hypothetical protein n=1 Tax=Methanolobus sp. WCC4 TaxID=3125784 RepID=UPI0030FA6281